jgi:short subunit dehydrogenase-like uncharacterized protein
MAAMVERDFDLMIYGASGFVGRRAVRYVAAHAQASGLRWAIAGRDRAKLEPLAEASGGIPVLVAAANDRAAIEAIVARTRVVLAMAGPFSLYADNLVDACVRLGTDYTDITGETPWIKSLIDRHHERAAEAGTRIVPACGFDSVPSDIGAYVVARYAQRELAVESADVKAFFQASGGLNGGTLATLMQVARDPVQGAQLRDPELLNPAGMRSPNTDALRDPVVASFDADVVAWIAPFVMGPINTRVVRRSAALFAQWGEQYGPNFAYQEYMAFPGPFGAALATTVAAGTVLAQTSLALGSTRGLLQPLVPKPGTGPSEYAIEHGWFRCELFARTAGARCVRGLIADRGDPGNAATVKFACEAAFALALDKAELPGGASRGGVLTPATALGDVLVRRLHDAGMTLEASLAV